MEWGNFLFRREKSSLQLYHEIYLKPSKEALKCIEHFSLAKNSPQSNRKGSQKLSTLKLNLEDNRLHFWSLHSRLRTCFLSKCKNDSQQEKFPHYHLHLCSFLLCWHVDIATLELFSAEHSNVVSTFLDDHQ